LNFKKVKKNAKITIKATKKEYKMKKISFKRK